MGISSLRPKYGIRYRSAHVYAVRIGHVDPRVGNRARPASRLQPSTDTPLHVSHRAGAGHPAFGQAGLR